MTQDGYTFLIDAGHWQGHECAKAVEALVPQNLGISLVILTHNDSDHLGNLPEILGHRGVGTLIWTGHVPPACQPLSNRDCPQAYTRATKAIEDAAGNGTTVINLKTMPLASGQVFELGQVELTFLAGWSDFPWPIGLSEAELQNAISIMTRISYAGNAMLVAGDAVGRPIDGASNSCDASEEWATQHVAEALLSSSVLVASHHGGDNGSSKCFVTAVAPEYVLFSAGAGYDHPRESTALRIMSLGLTKSHLLRTDRGSQSESKEWKDGLTKRCGDSSGDDDIEIAFVRGKPLLPRYLKPDKCTDI